MADVVGAPGAPGASRLIAGLSSQVDDQGGVGWSMAQLEAWWEQAHDGGAGDLQRTRPRSASGVVTGEDG